MNQEQPQEQADGSQDEQKEEEANTGGAMS